MYGRNSLTGKCCPSHTGVSLLIYATMLTGENTKSILIRFHTTSLLSLMMASSTIFILLPCFLTSRMLCHLSCCMDGQVSTYCVFGHSVLVKHTLWKFPRVSANYLYSSQRTRCVRSPVSSNCAFHTRLHLLFPPASR